MACTGFFACEKKGAEKRNEVRPEATAQTQKFVPLSEEQIHTQGITFATAGPAVLEKTLTLPGEIQLNANKTARIMPRFAGVAREVFKGIGDRVQKGEILAVVESNESLSPYEIKAPLSGTVVDLKISPGELLAQDSPAFIIADLGIVWLDIGIFPEDLSRIKLGQSVLVRAPGAPDMTGTISFLDPMARGEARTLHARVVLQNQKGLFKPGLFAEAKITVGSVSAAVTIPKEALQTVDGHPCVFRKTPQGMEPVFVTSLDADEKRIAVKGLAAGDTVAAAGSFLLKSELEKASFSEEEDKGDEEKDKD